MLSVDIDVLEEPDDSLFKIEENFPSRGVRDAGEDLFSVTQDNCTESGQSETLPSHGSDWPRFL